MKEQRPAGSPAGTAAAARMATSVAEQRPDAGNREPSLNPEKVAYLRAQARLFRKSYGPGKRKPGLRGD
jgi:hypothetical protein